MSDQDTLLQTLIDSGILSAEDATRLSSAWGDARQDERAMHASDSGDAVIKKLSEMGKLSRFQSEVLDREGPSGLLLGDYVLTDQIGAGGMGEVYRAVHRIMRREVAIKRLKTNHINAPGLAERFMREVQTAAKLTHPNIVTAYDAGEDAAGCYLVMEYVPGRDLAQFIRASGPVPQRQAAEWLQQAALALDYAHQAGIIHRDVKPANFLIDDTGRLKLLDLGLARIEQTLAEAEQSQHLTLTQADQIVGTLAYMAPEQAADPHAASVPSDLYALGCTFCHMIQGQPPFPTKSATQAIIAHRESPPPDLSASLPRGLNALYQEMVAKDPADRPASAGDIVKALDEIIASDVFEQPIAPGKRHARKTSTHKTNNNKHQSKLNKKPTRPAWLIPSSIAAAVLITVAIVGIVLIPANDESTDTAQDGTNIPGQENNPDAPSFVRHEATILNTTKSAATLQTAQGERLDQPIEVTNSIGMKLRYIPSGGCRQGSTAEQVQWAMEQVTAEGLFDRYGQYIESETPQKLAHIRKPFYAGATEVTVGQFRQFVQATSYKTLPESDGKGAINFTTGYSEPDASWDNPGMQQDDTHPVINITLSDAVAFCNWLSEKEGQAYRLPTDEEWEYACRAGSLGRWCFGDDPSEFYEYGWCVYNSPNSTKPVAKLKPNAFGLHDMHGNAREWVLFNDLSQANENGTGIVRGGSFTKPQVLLRSASRIGFKAKSPYPYHGFRVVRELEPADND